MNLKRGINLGGFLSQCCHELEHYKSFVVESEAKSMLQKLDIPNYNQPVNVVNKIF